MLSETAETEAPEPKSQVETDRKALCFPNPSFPTSSCLPPPPPVREPIPQFPLLRTRTTIPPFTRTRTAISLHCEPLPQFSPGAVLGPSALQPHPGIVVVVAAAAAAAVADGQ
ncbi:hypothetical protein Vretimale_14216 [Volvox reticuliferus]|uniref:Uncharacterized protein n=1 Tax=Volvox reticuliferus TaxID=1737510 RepID=A0A8J4CUG4_9CHLO|nr:hypothetical protein Vretifemale_15192 [Volvox reticuliferus]GIM10567.1 hypothetical protein Vretimale_14216 [Volvox reticuliferus]